MLFIRIHSFLSSQRHRRRQMLALPVQKHRQLPAALLPGRPGNLQVLLPGQGLGGVAGPHGLPGGRPLLGQAIQAAPQLRQQGKAAPIGIPQVERVFLLMMDLYDSARGK